MRQIPCLPQAGRSLNYEKEKSSPFGGTTGSTVTIASFNGSKINGLSGFSTGADIYISNTPGLLSQTPGFIKPSVDFSDSPTSVILRQPRRKYNFGWTVSGVPGIQRSGTLYSVKLRMPFAPNNISLVANSGNAVGIGGIPNFSQSYGIYSDGSQITNGVSHNSILGSAKTYSVANKIAELRSSNDSVSFSANILSVDASSFTFNVSNNSMSSSDWSSIFEVSE